MHVAHAHASVGPTRDTVLVEFLNEDLTPFHGITHFVPHHVHVVLVVGDRAVQLRIAHRGHLGEHVPPAHCLRSGALARRLAVNVPIRARVAAYRRATVILENEHQIRDFRTDLFALRLDHRPTVHRFVELPIPDIHHLIVYIDVVHRSAGLRRGPRDHRVGAAPELLDGDLRLIEIRLANGIATVATRIDQLHKARIDACGVHIGGRQRFVAQVLPRDGDEGDVGIARVGIVGTLPQRGHGIDLRFGIVANRLALGILHSTVGVDDLRVNMEQRRGRILARVLPCHDGSRLVRRLLRAGTDNARLELVGVFHREGHIHAVVTARPVGVHVVGHDLPDGLTGAVHQILIGDHRARLDIETGVGAPDPVAGEFGMFLIQPRIGRHRDAVELPVVSQSLRPASVGAEDVLHVHSAPLPRGRIVAPVIKPGYEGAIGGAGDAHMFGMRGKIAHRRAVRGPIRIERTREHIKALGEHRGACAAASVILPHHDHAAERIVRGTGTLLRARSRTHRQAVRRQPHRKAGRVVDFLYVHIGA